MMSRNIEIFDAQVAIVLALLYDNFPKSIEFDCVYLESKTVDKRITAEEHREFCRDTILFLEENEFISIQSKAINRNVFSGIKLTMHGLQVLKQTPKSISNEPAVGETISSMVKEGLMTSAIGLINSTVMKIV